MNLFEKLCPKKAEEPCALAKLGKGVLIGVGIVAGIAAVFTLVEVVLVKFFKKCITLTIQCTDLSAYDEEDEEFEEEIEEEIEEEAAEEAAAE